MLYFSTEYTSEGEFLLQYKIDEVNSVEAQN